MLAGVGKIGRIGGAGSGSAAAGLTGFVSVWATTVASETITIPTQNDTFNAVVDWGDTSPLETITTFDGFVHTYATAGDHTISITGTFPNIYTNLAADRLKIKKVLNLGTVGWTNFNYAFSGCTNLNEFTVGSTDTSSVTNMAYMFQSCFNLTSLDLSSFDTSNVTNMFTVFYFCTGLTSVDVSSFDTSSVTNMAYMFSSASALPSVDVSSFDTSSVTHMGNMFSVCDALTSIVGAEDWAITGLDGTGDLNNFLTGGKMTTAQYDALLVNWEAQASGIPAMTPNFGTSTYTGGSAAATAHDSLTDTYGWSIGDSGIEPSAFESVWATTAINETITIPTQAGTFNADVDWGDGTAVQNITTSTGFTHVYTDIDDYTISITGTFPNIYLYLAADRLKIKKVLNLGTVGWTNLLYAFLGCSNLTEFTVGSADTSAVTRMDAMFYGCSGLTSIDLSSFSTSSVTGSMDNMFFSCSGLTSVDVSNFVTSSVTNMTRMFFSCNALTSIVGAEDFDITGLSATGSLTDFITNGKMTTAQYDNLLVNWEAQASGIPAMTPSFGTSTYTGGSAAATAHASLNDTYGWSIGDSGIEPSAFISVWETSAINETITIPTQAGTFNADVDWGDGTTETITSSTGFTHVYADIDEYTISISGVFPNMYFNDLGDKDKLKKVTNLGTVGWTTLTSAFFGCTNLTEFTAGSTDTSNVTTTNNMFRSCTGLTSLNLSSFDTSLVTNTRAMFHTCSGLTSLNVTSFVTSSVANMFAIFYDCSGLTSIVGVEDWDITGLDSTDDLTSFLTLGKMTTAQYDALLVNWEAQAEFPGMSPSFGASKYTGGGTAAAARAAMLTVGRYNAIYDGGIA